MEIKIVNEKFCSKKYTLYRITLLFLQCFLIKNLSPDSLILCRDDLDDFKVIKVSVIFRFSNGKFMFI